MDLRSIRSRLLGSYVILILLFVIQTPVIYLIVAGMGKRYTQVEAAGSLRMRAVDLSYILNRHILGGEEELEGEFQRKKTEYGQVIDDLKHGAGGASGVIGTRVLERLDAVGQKWIEVKSDLDSAMERGDKLRGRLGEMERATPAMVDRLRSVANGFASLKDASYGNSIDAAGTQAMRAVNMSYLLERYVRTADDRDRVAAMLQATVRDFDTTLTALRDGSAGLGIKAARDSGLHARLKEAGSQWAEMKELVYRAMEEKDAFHLSMAKVIHTHTPALVAAADALTKEIGAGAVVSGRTTAVVAVAIVCLSAAVAALFMWLINRQVIRPVVMIKEAVEGYTRGDLARKTGVRVSFLGGEIKDEVTGLGESVDEMASRMSEVMGRVADSSNQLVSASEQLSATSGQIAAGADRQSVQTAQVATAVEEMSATVVEVARNSQQASETASATRDIASKGGTVVMEAIAAMKEVADSTAVTAETIKRLDASSVEIGTIVSVINDIADQTNLLALNAAIEAARAGDQGRGFAVVADEVRRLAERTTKATKEINSMIESIQGETSRAVSAMDEGARKVDNGVRLANEAGESLKRIVEGVENVTDMIAHIATSAEQQSATTEEITRNMDSIAGVAKANVNAISEVAKASRAMAELAFELKEMVSRFGAGSGGIRPSAERDEPHRGRLDASQGMGAALSSKPRQGNQPRNAGVNAAQGPGHDGARQRAPRRA
jgi:methyl-accepting chemotaxis protein